MAPAPSKGKDDARKMFKGFTVAFPDMKVSVTNAWGIEDFAILESTVSGTHKAPFMGIAATKRAIVGRGADIMQVKDGKIVKGVSYGNGAEMMTQLGVWKPPAASKSTPVAAKLGAAKGPAPATPAPKK